MARPRPALRLMMPSPRARGWALRDKFGDVLKGLYTAEEAQDIPAAVVVEHQQPPVGRVSLRAQPNGETKAEPPPEIPPEMAPEPPASEMADVGQVTHEAERKSRERPDF